MRKKPMTVADLAAYLRTIPNQNMKIYIDAKGDSRFSDEWAELGGFVYKADYDSLCVLHMYDHDAKLSCDM